MKKILLLLSILFVFCTLISCGDGECEHDFSSANCKAPKTCTLCGATEGEIGEHVWKIDCTTPKICEICGLTDGEASGHDWSVKLCTEDKECNICGEKEIAKEHTWDTEECLMVPVCVECDFIGSEIQHNWAEATCVLPKTCKQCAETIGEALGHDWIVPSCKNPKICATCYETSTEDLPHRWVYNGCDKERTCSVCYLNEGVIYGHHFIDATCTAPKHCEDCGKTEGVTASHNWQEATCERAKFCEKCEMTDGSPLGHNWMLKSTVEALCEGEKEVYFCNRCEGSIERDLNNPKIGYHVCDTDGLCSQCGKKYDTDKMVLESVLIANEHSVKCAGIFISKESTVKIYKSITSKDVGIPVVDLGGELPTVKGEDEIKIVDVFYDSEELSFVCAAEIKVQGASSAGKPKKNFNIKLYELDGSKKNIELFDGWGEENKYCMKANYIDFSQSRNVVSGKIFGEIVKSRNDELAATPNGGAIDGYPILVYNNGEYQGVYTMNIPKDKWMFHMDDSDEKNQAIIMAENWNNAVSFRDVSTSGFVLEYASNEDSLIDDSTQWVYDSLLDLIRFVYYNDGENFKNGIHQYADVDKCIDSMLYTFFICADDNTSKNILWVTLDGKVWFSSMYDMDGTWGMRWNGNIEFDENTHPISALVDGKGLAPERNHSNLNLLWERIYVNYYDRVCERYWELRQEILTEENISNHFETFFDSIPDTIREAEREKWTGVPSQNIDHLEQILTFAKKRIEVMDKILVLEETN